MIHLAAIATLLTAAAPPRVIVTPAVPARLLSPVEGVMMAAEAAPRGVHGTFVMTVRATGRGGGDRLFLNSELDYRDQRNLSIVVAPTAVATLLDKARVRDDAALVGRKIAVTGIARRARIDFITNGRPSGKYYFQTHVPVTRTAQVAFLPPSDAPPIMR